MEEKAIMAQARQVAEGRANWLLGAGGDDIEKVLTRLHMRGLVGPLWEFLIR